MVRETYTYAVSVPITTPVLLLQPNSRRIMYSLQNLDPANYIAYSSNPNVAAAGTATANEGFHVTAGQTVSDDEDQDVIYAVANTAAVIVSVTEVTEVPGPTRQPREPLRVPPRELRRQAGRPFSRTGSRQVG